MLVYKGSYPEDDMQNWFISKLPTAKETLKRFPILDSLLNSFADYEQKQFRDIQNSIMFLCLPYSDGSYRGQIQLLEILEKTLKILKVNTWPISKTRDLKSRIASEKFDVSYSAQTELEAVAEMLSILGEDNYTGDKLTLYPKLENNRKSDIRLVLDGQPVFIEIGYLSSARPIEERINRILGFCAKHLGEQVSHTCLLVEVDTAEFTFSNRVMDEFASIQQLISEIDGLKLSQLAGYEGSFTICDILWLMQNKELFEHEKHELQNAPYLEITENPITEKWISSLNLIELQKTKIITGVIGSSWPQEFPLVEIHSEGLYPSKAGRAEIQSFINHLINQVGEQLSQVQPHAPNVIAVRVNKFMLTSLSLFAEIGNLQTAIGKLFEEKQNGNLFGIALYHDSLKKAIFFNNPYASADSILSNVEMTKFGFHSPTYQDFRW